MADKPSKRAGIHRASRHLMRKALHLLWPNAVTGVHMTPQNIAKPQLLSSSSAHDRAIDSAGPSFGESKSINSATRVLVTKHFSENYLGNSCPRDKEPPDLQAPQAILGSPLGGNARDDQHQSSYINYIVAGHTSKHRTSSTVQSSSTSPERGIQLEGKTARQK